MIGHWWHAYWAWAGSNIGAMPAEAVITVVTTLLLVRPATRLWHRIAPERPSAARAREAAERALRIAADLYEHHTGRAHELAPGTESEAR